MAGQTPWQTTGPFFHFGLPWKGGADLTGDSELGARKDLIQPGHDYGVTATSGMRAHTIGERIEIFGHVWDNKGAPIVDCLIELWQANAAGRYAHPEDTREDVAPDPAFIGFGRTASDRQGGYRFRTIKPGRVPGPGNSLQAPHIALGLMGPGFLKRLATRVYFPSASENAEDPILGLVPEERRSTLIAVRAPESPSLYRFDIRLGGAGETVFFDI
ncbi:MAG TPA: protocatechuate 3,4-dioxygenase subunit alpha [Micropepsaceae bacterium]